MALRIVKTIDATPKAKPRKQADYLSFIRALPCAVTGVFGVQAAHVSYAAPEYGAYGRGKQSKVSDRWALPLSPEAHARQHSMSERDYWLSVGKNPHETALILFGLWSEYGDLATDFATAVIMQRIFQR